MRVLLTSCVVFVTLLVALASARRNSNSQNYEELYRANRGSKRTSSSPVAVAGEERADATRSISDFIHGANSALEKVLAYGSFLETTDPAIPVNQRKGALLRTQESLFSAAQSVLVTQHRARDPQAAQAAAMRQKKDGSVGFAEDVKGMLGITSPVDPQGEAYLARQGDGQQLDEIESATKTFADALAKNVRKGDTRSTLAPSVTTGLPSSVKGFPQTDEQLKAAESRQRLRMAQIGEDMDREVAPGLTRRHIQDSMKLASSSHPSSSSSDINTGKSTVASSRSFDTQATVDGSVVNATVLYENVPDNFCADGAVAVPNTTVFTCVANGTTTTGVTAGDFLALTREQQANCSFPVGTSVQCVCPIDGFLGTALFGSTTCYGRRITCENNILRPDLSNCPKPSINDNFAEPVCFSISRSTTPTITVESNTTCGFVYTSPEVYLAVGVTVEEIAPDVESLSMVSLPAFNFREEEKIIPATGTYLELQERSFNYVAGPTFTSVGSGASVDTPQRFGLTADHPVVTRGQFFAEIYNFNKMSDRSGLKLQKVDRTVASQLAGNTTTWQYAVEAIEDGHIAGGRAYMEVGFEGGTVGVAAKGFSIDISDYPVPAPRGGVRGLALSLIILICVVVGIVLIIGAILGFRWYRKKDQKSLDLEEEY